MSQIESYKVENERLSRYEQLYNDARYQNDVLQRQVDAWKEKDRRTKEREEAACNKRAKDRAKLKEQLKTYEKLLDTRELSEK